MIEVKLSCGENLRLKIRSLRSCLSELRLFDVNYKNDMFFI